MFELFRGGSFSRLSCVVLMKPPWLTLSYLCLLLCEGITKRYFSLTLGSRTVVQSENKIKAVSATVARQAYFLLFSKHGGRKLQLMENFSKYMMLQSGPLCTKDAVVDTGMFLIPLSTAHWILYSPLLFQECCKKADGIISKITLLGAKINLTKSKSLSVKEEQPLSKLSITQTVPTNTKRMGESGVRKWKCAEICTANMMFLKCTQQM